MYVGSLFAVEGSGKRFQGPFAYAEWARGFVEVARVPFPAGDEGFVGSSSSFEVAKC